MELQGLANTTGTPLAVILEQGLKAMWEDSEIADLQEQLLYSFVEHTRKVPKEYIQKTVEYLKNLGAFYVPNDDFISTIFGQEIRSYRYGVYHSGGETCKYYKRLAIPLRYMDGTLFGFCGYSDGSSEGETPDGADHIKYLYPTKDIFQKDRYMFVERDEMMKAMQDDYVCLTDGLFDKVSLQVQGYNAISLCGSALSKWHKMYLTAIKYKIVLPDNDSAGKALAERCKREMKNTLQIKQGVEWDIDDWLKTSEGRQEFKRLFEQMVQEGFVRDLTATKRKPNKVNTEEVI